MEVMEKDFKIQALQEMEGHPAWELYQAHLEQLCRIKEVEKSQHLRVNRLFDAAMKQSEIDGINLARKSITSLISSLSEKTES